MLRGRARMAAGDTDGARKGKHNKHLQLPEVCFVPLLTLKKLAPDLHKVLELQPDHAVATSLLAITSNAVTKTVRAFLSLLAVALSQNLGYAPVE